MRWSVPIILVMPLWSVAGEVKFQEVAAAAEHFEATGGSSFTEEQKSFWAFQPVAAPPLPSVSNGDWPTTPVDFFVLARLEERGLEPAPPATKNTWLRRVTFDTIGLPPTLAELDDFLADDLPSAEAKVVERLLASGHYGERWARRSCLTRCWKHEY